MQMMKKILKVLFWIVIIGILVTPLFLIYQLSNAEMQEYAAPTLPVFRESTIGRVHQATRQDVPEYICIDGSFVSSSYEFMELPYWNASNIRWLVEVGEEITEGQVLGYYDGKEVISTLTGIIVEKNLYTGTAYIKVRLFEPVEFVSQIDDATLSTLNRAESLTTEDGEAVTILGISNTKQADGTRKVTFSIDSQQYVYGETVDNFVLYTGRVYTRALVLPVDCVYQKEPGDDNPWLARQVTEDGYFIAEVEVQIGYSNEDYICVSGIQEGTWYDTGYKALIEEPEND